jgi:hypothetical protein
MPMSQFGKVYQELTEAGWKWQGHRLISPSGTPIDNPTAEDLLKLRAAMSVESVLAAHAPQRAKGASSAA